MPGGLRRLRASSPRPGEATAKVHIVALDPACETARRSHPLVKQVLAQNPQDPPVRLPRRPPEGIGLWCACSRRAGCRTSTGRRRDAACDPVAVDSAITRCTGPVFRQSATSASTSNGCRPMDSAQVVERAQRDRADAMTLKVTVMTPEYFVNGRQMPSFGEQQPMTLIGEELRRHN